MIGERIKSLRRKKRYSITELAKRAGVSKSYLSYIERDVQKNPSLQFLTKIAETLDTSMEYLLGDEEKCTTFTKDMLDKEWTVLLQKAIDDGLSKEDFREFQNFVRFRNWQNEQDDKVKNFPKDGGFHDR
ncbi:helix-turn-helix domain-containing protein [Bacillus timonensis]|uniref:helix-turn-helix domain-containing protein n=1 Tax=Bacillus timonensis TaxID=1033734 RepID=UPI000288F960|nr:helix-turn-helix domain-containing protein [Bacillus timonensis]